MSYALQPTTGYRRYDVHFAAAEATARRFEGLKRGASPSHALAAFKRAAPQLGVSARLVHLIDLLFAWTKPQDWTEGQKPIVWPKNETLAENMGLEIRQVQNLLKRAVALRLVSHEDSPNGHRGGLRDGQGFIRWAYGIDLRPIGTRMGDFVRLAEEAAVERKLRDALKRRLTIARKSVNQIAQSAIENGFVGCDWSEEAELARMAVELVRGSRSLEQLTAVAEQTELRVRRVHAAFTTAMGVAGEAFAEASGTPFSVDIAPTDEKDCTDYTTTNHLQTAKAEIRNGLADRSSGLREGGSPFKPATLVETDLDKHGIGVEFLRTVCKTNCWELDYGKPTWREVVGIGENLAASYFVSSRSWSEACRILGTRGAAAAMIAIAEKGEAVENPPAYLNGMIKRALRGELNLGRTFHGLKGNVTVQ